MSAAGPSSAPPAAGRDGPSLRQGAASAQAGAGAAAPRAAAEAAAARTGAKDAAQRGGAEAAVPRTGAEAAALRTGAEAATLRTGAEAAALRTGAEAAASGLPPLLAEARLLAATVLMGEHGRRRSGPGTEFWQYRPVHSGDEARHIDHRRSARSDQQFVRDREWQAAQSVMIWSDAGQSMGFASAPQLPRKSDRAALLALASAVLLVRGGERVGLTALGTPPQRGEVQLLRIAEALARQDDPAEYGVPSLDGLPAQARALFLSDFLGDPEKLAEALGAAADRGVRGALVMVLDPQEEAFPFSGRTIFESLGGALRFETQKARDLRERYLDRLAERKDLLARMAATAGWQFFVHHTDASAQSALLWLHGAIGGRG